MNHGVRLFWTSIGVLFLGFGVMGIVLPLVPTTPFLLLAAFCFARSSPRLHNWLLAHRAFGPMISNWQRYGSIDRRSKRIALVVIALTLAFSLAIGVPWWALATQIAVLGIVANFILTRPETTE